MRIQTKNCENRVKNVRIMSMKEKEITPEELKKLTSAIDPLPVEVVEGAKLKLRLQEVDKQYKIAHAKFMDLFDSAWNEVLSRRHDKAEEATADDIDASLPLFLLLKSDLAERGFKLFIDNDPSRSKSLFLQKWFWKNVIEHELDLLLKKKEDSRDLS